MKTCEPVKLIQPSQNQEGLLRLIDQPQKWWLVVLVVLLMLRGIACGSTIVISTSTIVNVGMTNYDGADLIVSNCALTINGPHPFNSLLLTNSAVLTETAGTSNTFLVVSNNMTIDALSRVDVSGKGYGAASGPGSGISSGCVGGGGGYGGDGGSGSGGIMGGAAYGSAMEPMLLGSGGGNGYNGAGGAGGGFIQFSVAGNLTVNGSILANGNAGTGGCYCAPGGGSGGSIYLIVGTLAGSGTISASGGAGGCVGYSGWGGGGRMAVYYETFSYTGQFEANGGTGTSVGGAGTLFLKASSDPLGQVVVDGGTTNSVGLTPLSDSNSVPNLQVQGGAQLYVTGGMSVNGGLVVSGSNTVVFLAGTSTVAQSVSLTNGGILTHVATSNGTVLTVSGDMTIDALSRVDVSGKGYGAASGPGSGISSGCAGSGGGYGGSGGASLEQPGGTNYGGAAPPFNLGSGGGNGNNGPGGAGGGSIELSVGDNLTINGAVLANGNAGTGGCACGSGGGSGGGIWLNAGTLFGDGLISAVGGAGACPNYAGGGAGGRIALIIGTNSFTGSISNAGGIGAQNGQPGTLYTTPIDHQLVLSQQVYGRIDSPNLVNRWLFSAVAGRQVRFQQINASPSGVVFDLNGPGGWSGFSGITNQSALATLTNSGNYNLTVRAQNFGYHGAYTFVLEDTTETNLALSVPFTGNFVGNGQAQLIAVIVTNSGPLLIALNNAGSKNTTELYAQLGVPPTRGTFGWSSINPNSPNQQILIPNANAGTYYLLVYGSLISTPGNYTVQVQTGSVL